MKKRKTLKRILWTLAILFILMNVVAYFHAYKFTHFSNRSIAKTKAADLSTGEKMKAAIFGVNNPRPRNTCLPAQPFELLVLQSNKKIECWHIKRDNAKGTVLIFHGYSGEKSSMLDKSDEFIKLGYNVILVDFMGSGGSEGNQTTIGYKEAEEVKTVFDYINRKGEKNIYLFGTSMGAVAIMKAINDYHFNPKAIILECPFGSMYKTTCARFRAMNIPSFPMAGMLDFWGGIQNGFWAFKHNPTEYAKQVICPTMLLYGEKDERVSREETDEIFTNLQGAKQLKTFPLAGHENYLKKYKTEWIEAVTFFMQKR
jgi:alpha-beta hydrolase superfamily lysophospholipase